MTATSNANGAQSALDPQPKALHVAAIIHERLGIDCLVADLLESQHARIAELEAQVAAKCPQPVKALLFEHDDGRYAVNPDTTNDPAWHRMGPVQAYGLASPMQCLQQIAKLAAPQQLPAAT